jgi:hypothetical protein
VNIAKTFSALSLALALQAGALVAATVILAPSDATAASHSKKKAPKKSQKKAPARGKIRTRSSIQLPGEPQPPMDKNDPPRDDGRCCKGVPDLQKPPPSKGGNTGPDCETHPDLCRNTAHKRN